MDASKQKQKRESSTKFQANIVNKCALPEDVFTSKSITR
jgi:hypothetical protein